MIATRAWVIVASLLLCLSSVRHASAAPAAGQPSTPDQPPLSWTCPMHPDVVESSEGTCRICKMKLVAVRLDTVWTCPVHAAIVERKPSRCPIDRRDLVPMTVAVSWSCPGRADISEITPGTCPGGAPMEVRYMPRPHGSHFPQHGGQFFMAPDNWHHLEGAYPRAGVVRLYLYDDYSRPLPIDQARRATGRIVTKETFDAATRTTQETVAFPLALAPNGLYLTARVNARSVPVQWTAKIRFKDDGPEYRFDFAFGAFSRDPRLAASGRPVDGSTRASEGRTAAAVPIANADAPPPGVDASPTAIPDTVEEMVVQLDARRAQVADLIDRGAFGEIYVPAFQAKDLALALEAHSGQLPPEKQGGGAPAIRRLVQAAWLLDAFGDVGNRQQVADAYTRFASSVAEIQALFAAGR